MSPPVTDIRPWASSRTGLLVLGVLCVVLLAPGIPLVALALDATSGSGRQQGLRLGGAVAVAALGAVGVAAVGVAYRGPQKVVGLRLHRTDRFLAPIDPARARRAGLVHALGLGTTCI